jgi:hypothetical protein
VRRRTARNTERRPRDAERPRRKQWLANRNCESDTRVRSGWRVGHARPEECLAGGLARRRTAQVAEPYEAPPATAGHIGSFFWSHS